MKRRRTWTGRPWPCTGWLVFKARRSGVLTYPQSILERENHDSGDYLFILHLADAKDIAIGSKREFLSCRLLRLYRVGPEEPGCPSGPPQPQTQEDALAHRLPAPGSRRRRRPAVRTADDLEHDLARAVDAVADWRIEGFGCTDCDCPSHLFGFAENPIHYRPFIQVVEDFRMNRLASLMTDTGAFVKKD